MEFDSNVQTEITAPNNVPFEPGNNIIGIGSEVPLELQGIYPAAIIFYTSNWNPANTRPTVKYMWIAMASIDTPPTSTTGLAFRYAICQNPSVSQVPTLHDILNIDVVSNATQFAHVMAVFNHTYDNVVNMGEDNTGDGQIATFNDAGVQTGTLP